MKAQFPLLAVAGLALAATPCTVKAQSFTPITQWNFNSITNDANSATGTTTPSIGAGTLSNIGGTTSTFAAGSPGDPVGTTPAADNSGYNVTAFPAQGTNSGTAGVQFNVSTAGFPSAIQISLDFRQSGSASRYFQLQLSSNGTTFTNATGGVGSFGTTNATNTLTSFDNNGLYTNNSGGGTQNFVQAITYTLPAGSVYADDPTFAFRWVSVFDQSGVAPGNYIASNAGTAAGYGTTGTARFDEVTISQGMTPVPEPSTYFAGALTVAAFGITLLRRVRRTMPACRG